jgi:hypothetical protein
MPEALCSAIWKNAAEAEAEIAASAAASANRRKDGRRGTGLRYFTSSTSNLFIVPFNLRPSETS